MAKTVTATAVKRIIAKGLTGWEAGKLILQDLIDTFFGKDSVLSEGDVAAIQQAPMQSADIRDYNLFMGLYRGFHRGYMLAEWACKDACLQIGFLDHILQDADKRRTVELFESFGPRVVTRKQYEAIAAAQREKKLEFEYSLGYVIEERFYATAPPQARQEIEKTGGGIESVADFAAAVPEAHTGLCKQGIDQIHRLHTTGKLPAVYHEENAKEVEPLLRKWEEEGLSYEEVTGLLDMLYVTGRRLYECEELPEWKRFIEQYQRQWLADADERFGHAYAVLEDCPEAWLDKKGNYKGPSKPSEWITRGTELLLGLIDHRNKAEKSIERVGAELRNRLDAAERNIRLFLAIKAVLDAAAEAVELEVPGEEGLLASPNAGLGAVIALYNLRLKELKEEREAWESAETRLEKTLGLLPAVDTDRLRPSPESLQRLRAKVLEDTRSDDWLRLKITALEYPDGFVFKDLLR